MTPRAALAFAMVLGTAAGCAEVAPLPPTGQVVFYVDTDAPLPAPATHARAANGSDGPALFDRLRVEVFAPGDNAPCDECSRDFALDAVATAAGRVSFGLVPQPGRAGYRVRLRLYRAGGVAGPRPASTVEHVVAIPVVTEEGIVEVSDFLGVDDLDAPRGTLDEPIEPTRGRPKASRVGTWQGARASPCDAELGAGEVCVPGGAFWLDDITTLDASLESLVRVSPFVLDATEVTVGAFRSSGLAKDGDPRLPTPTERACRYGASPTHYEQHPVNCIGKARAEAFCNAAGKRLPTRAELYWVHSAMRGAPYPWGQDPPTCEDAAFARNGDAPPPGRPYFDPEVASRLCQGLGEGTAAVGSGARDRLEIAGRVIVDLAGNVAEHVADQGPPCLERGFHENPVCKGSGAWQVSGGAWTNAAPSLVSGEVGAVEEGALRASVGFRCARSL